MRTVRSRPVREGNKRILVVAHHLTDLPHAQDPVCLMVSGWRSSRSRIQATETKNPRVQAPAFNYEPGGRRFESCSRARYLASRGNLPPQPPVQAAPRVPLGASMIESCRARFPLSKVSRAALYSLPAADAERPGMRSPIRTSGRIRSSFWRSIPSIARRSSSRSNFLFTHRDQRCGGVTFCRVPRAHSR